MTAAGGTIDTAARRGRPRLVAALVAALVAVAVAALVAVPRVQRFYRTPPLRITTMQADGSTLTDEPGVAAVPFRYGELYAYRFELVNESRWAVRVLGVPGDRGYELLEQDSVLVDGRPFQPFTLHRHEQREITVQSRFTDCTFYGFGGGQTYQLSRVAYRVLGVHREAMLDLPTQLKVTSPRQCPELAATSGDAAGGRAGRTIEGHLRFTLPDYRFWFTNWSSHALKDCKVDVDGGATTLVRRIAGRSAVMVPVDRFAAAGDRPWQPQADPPKHVTMQCAGTGVMTAGLSSRRDTPGAS